MTMRMRWSLVLLAATGLAVVSGRIMGAMPQDKIGPGEGEEPTAARIGQAFRIPYRLSETNHYLVRVRINGKGPFNFLVDSGAPALFVGTNAAKAIGLEPAEDDFWTPIDRLDIEGGATLLDLKARVEDPFQLVGMNALGLPGASIDGILGFTILARFRLEFDPTDDRMTWTRIDFEPKEPFIPRPVRTKQGPAKPAEVRAMEMLGPVMQGMAFLIGKQPEERRIAQGYLGIVLEPIDGDETLKVADVLEGSPAAEAGIRPGDVIETIDDTMLHDLDDAHGAVLALKPGDEVSLKVRRDGEARTIKLTAGEGL